MPQSSSDEQQVDVPSVERVPAVNLFSRHESAWQAWASYLDIDIARYISTSKFSALIRMEFSAVRCRGCRKTSFSQRYCALCHVTTSWQDEGDGEFRVLLNDPSLKIKKHLWRGVANSHNDQDSFMQNTLSTPDTIRDQVILVPAEPSNPSYSRLPEVLTIYSLGSSLMGHAMVAHGGLVATLLDEVMGVAININEQIEAESDPKYQRKSIMTLKLDLLYKKPVPAPGLILARAVLKKAEGRKRWIRATLEYGDGTILTEAEGLFLEVKRSQAWPAKM